MGTELLRLTAVYQHQVTNRHTGLITLQHPD